MRIAIIGAGIAGPTVAFWLRRSKHDVLIVEQAPALRRGGYVVDFWGAGYDIAEKMGLLPQIRAHGYQMREVRFVDARGRISGSFSADVFRRLTAGRFTSVPRSDISAALFAALDGRVETVFGDSVAAIEETDACVRLTFEHAAPRDVDLVIGADGLHSRVRQLVFGPRTSFEVSLGYHVAAFEAAGYRPRDELVYVGHTVPGRQISRFALRDDATLFLLALRDEYLAGQPLDDVPACKRALRRAFSDVAWESQGILAAMDGATGLYFDPVSQIRMDRWTKGRVALVGDAAACASLLAGEGAGLAMAEAYMLAGELRLCGNDHRAAFARYQSRLMPSLRRKQAAAARFASSLAPKTGAGVAFRDLVVRLLRYAAVADFFVGRGIRDDFRLPGYGFERS